MQAQDTRRRGGSTGLVTYSEPARLAKEWQDRKRGKKLTRRTEAMAENLTVESLGTLEFWRDRGVEDAGFVYFAGFLGEGPESKMVKIGYAADPVARITELQCGNPWKLVALRLVLGSRTLEGALHRNWKLLRVRGEWFRHDDSSFYLRRAHNAAMEQMVEFDKGTEDPQRLRWQIPASVLMGLSPEELRLHRYGV